MKRHLQTMAYTEYSTPPVSQIHSHPPPHPVLSTPHSNSFYLITQSLIWKILVISLDDQHQHWPWVRLGSDWVRRGSELCGVARTVARRLIVRQTRVRISARHSKGGPTSGSNEEIKSGDIGAFRFSRSLKIPRDLLKSDFLKYQNDSFLMSFMYYLLKQAYYLHLILILNAAKFISIITRYRVRFGFLIFPYITYAAVNVSNTKLNCTNMVINILESTSFFPVPFKTAFKEESANISPENVVKITQNLSFCICRFSILYVWIQASIYSSLYFSQFLRE